MAGKLLAGAGVLALAALLVWMYGDARFEQGRLIERDRWRLEQIDVADMLADSRVAAEQRVAAAAAVQADRVASIAAVMAGSREKVAHYAQTGAGGVRCLDDQRVRGIEQDRASLFPPTGATPAGGGADTVSADAAGEGG